MLENIIPTKEEAVAEAKRSLRGKARANTALAAVSAATGIGFAAATAASFPDKAQFVDSIRTDIAPWMGSRAGEAAEAIGNITGIDTLKRTSASIGRDVERQIGTDLAQTVEDSALLGPATFALLAGAAGMYAVNRWNASRKNIAESEILK